MGLAQANLRYAYTGNEELDDGLTAANRALALDPTIAEAHLPRAWHLAMPGETDEAAGGDRDRAAAQSRIHGRRTRKRRGSTIGRASWPRRRAASRKGDRACRRRLPQPRDAIGLISGNRAKLSGRGNAPRKVIEQVEAALARDPDNGAALAFGALSFAARGQLERAREWIDRALLLDPDNMYMRYNLAWPVLSFFDDKEGALDLLEPALAKAGNTLISLAAADRNLDPLRDDPRFQKMLERCAAASSASPPRAPSLVLLQPKRDFAHEARVVAVGEPFGFGRDCRQNVATAAPSRDLA